MTDATQIQCDAWRWRGPNSGADGWALRAGERTLVLILEPVSLVVAVPALPGGEPALTRFCRTLGRAVVGCGATQCF